MIPQWRALCGKGLINLSFNVLPLFHRNDCLVTFFLFLWFWQANFVRGKGGGDGKGGILILKLPVNVFIFISFECIIFWLHYLLHSVILHFLNFFSFILSRIIFKIYIISSVYLSFLSKSHIRVIKKKNWLQLFENKCNKFNVNLLMSNYFSSSSLFLSIFLSNIKQSNHKFFKFSDRTRIILMKIFFPRCTWNCFLKFSNKEPLCWHYQKKMMKKENIKIKLKHKPKNAWLRKDKFLIFLPHPNTFFNQVF